MTPAQALEMLERQLGRHGEPVTVHVPMSGGFREGVPVMAFVRGFKPDQLVGAIKQGDKAVTLSPRPLVPYAEDIWADDIAWLDGLGWEGWSLVEGLRVKIDGKSHRVEQVETIRIGGTPVRHNLVVRG